VTLRDGRREMLQMDVMRTYWLLVVSLAVSACGSTSTPTTSAEAGSDTTEPEMDTAVEDSGANETGAAAVTIKVGSYYYNPKTVTIKVGETVEWVWVSGTHSVTSGSSCTADGKFDSANHATPYTYTRTFTETGTFPYFCKYMSHCANGQVGTITVTP
jgi:plastocyanin